MLGLPGIEAEKGLDKVFHRPGLKPSFLLILFAGLKPSAFTVGASGFIRGQNEVPGTPALLYRALVVIGMLCFARHDNRNGTVP
jgi:hypothetical protein